MRLSNTRALVLGVAAIAASGFVGDTGCSPSKATEIVPGALTQVKVPDNLSAIKLVVLANGAPKFCQGYAVMNGGVQLPSTLGVIGGTSSVTLRVSLYGYDKNYQAGSNDWQNCGQMAAVGGGGTDGGPRVLRESILTYVDQHTLFLPMPLSFACYDVACSSDKTCKGGQCIDINVQPKSLADFTPSLVDGKQDCFSPSQCFSSATDATVVDASSCTYALPAGAPTTAGFNVRVAYAQGTWAADPGTGKYGASVGVPVEDEILNQDPDEGYTIPDPSSPTQFKLAPGLCALAQAATTPSVPAPSSGTKSYPVISDVSVAVGCSSKLPLLPICASEQHGNVSTTGSSPQISCGVPIVVEPASSAVYVVADDSASMSKAFGPQGYATVMNLSFADPVFKRTYIAFKFLTHNAAECTGGSTAYTTPTVDWDLAPAVQPQIAPLLKNVPHPTPPDTACNPADLNLLAAMRTDQGAYKHVADFAGKLGAGNATLNGASVMFFVNRTPLGPAAPGDGGAGDAGDAGGGCSVAQRTSGLDCDPTTVLPTSVRTTTVQKSIENAVKAATAQGLQTYFVVLDNDDHDRTPLSFFQQIQTDLGNAGGASVMDATSTDPAVVLGNFEQTVTSAVTCVYDQPSGIDTTASVSFTVPPATPGINPAASPAPVPIPFASSCKASSKTDLSIDGWNIDGNRIVVCGQSCAKLQTVIGAVTAAALQAAGDAGVGGADGGVPKVPEDVPVTVTMPCTSNATP
jgi:hypothetical protein